MNTEIYDVDSFFLQILSEYKKYKNPEEKCSTCFIYDYMKKKNLPKITSVSQSAESIEEYANMQRINKYVLLRAMLEAYKNKVISKAYFTQLFVKLTGDASFETATNDAKKEIVKKYTHDFLIGTIDDFFGNRGYSVSQSTKTKEAKKTKKKTDGELEMLCQYYKYSYENGQGNLLSSTAVAIDEDYIRKCTELLNTLIEEDNDEVFVPLYFDPKHGAGVFIVGTSYYQPESNESASEATGKCCVVLAAYVNDVYSDDLDADLEIGLCSDVYTTVSDAFDYLRKNTYTFYSAYAFINNNNGPENLNDIFKPFFYSDATKKRKRKREADRQDCYDTFNDFETQSLL